MDEPKVKNTSGMTIGYTIMAAMFLCTFIGYKIDEKIKKGSSMFTLIGVFFGMAFSGYEVWKLVKSKENEDQK